MSRLVENQVKEISDGITKLNTRLVKTCGAGLLKIAAAAAGLPPESSELPAGMSVRPVAVVPVTTGLGVIPGFCHAVKNILEFLGVPAYVTEHTDVRGLTEAVRRGAEIFFIADDNTFSAVNIARGLCSDNSEATGRGFAAALEKAAYKRDDGIYGAYGTTGLTGKDVLILGVGPVGVSAARYALERFARVSIYDIDTARAVSVKNVLPGVEILDEFPKCLKEISLVVDATPAEHFIKYNMLREDTIISSPGVPEGFDPECERKLNGRVIYDCLAIGVATMLMDVLKYE